MTQLFVYRQLIKWEGDERSHLTFTENPPDECNLQDAQCLGFVTLYPLPDSNVAMTSEKPE